MASSASLLGCPYEWKGLTCRRVNGGAVTGLGNGFPAGAAGLQPCSFCNLHFAQRLLGSAAKGGAGFQVGDVGDVAAVLLAVKQVDMVVAHGFSR